MEQKNFNHLLLIKDPAVFIESCYLNLLDRNVSPGDILEIERLFLNGMPKEGLIYCIARSKEFNNRFSIQDINLYKKKYFLYKCQSIFKKSANHSRSHSITPDEIFPPMPDRSAPDEAQINYQALALCNMSYLEHLIADASPQATVMTELTKIYSLLTGNELPTFASKVMQKFLFVMPSLPLPKDALACIWEKGWHPLSSSCRFFQGSASFGRLIIFNNSDSYRKVSLRLHLSSTENGSELFIYYPGATKKYSLSAHTLSVKEHIYLSPFYNELPFLYIGEGLQSPCTDNHLIKFFLEDISITLSNQAETKGADADAVFHLDTEDLGDSYFPYLLPDSYIRTQLHRNGFFEISACKILNSYEVIPLETTRYNYLGDANGRRGYYLYTSNSQPSTEAGVILYTAKRTGTLSID